MRALNIDKFYQGSVLRPIFQNFAFDIRPMKGAGDDNFAMKSSFYLQGRSFFENLMLLSGNVAIFLLSYAVFRTLVPMRRLNAICRKRTSMAFLNNLVNLAWKALLWRWEIPKYCSTIYRTLEMALFRSFSNVVNSVPRTALVMMPSAILFI